MDSIQVSFENMPEILEKLKSLAKTADKMRYAKAIFRESAKPLVSAAKAEAPVADGTLKRSIAFIASKKDKGLFYVGARRGKRQKNNAYYSHMVIFGSKHNVADPFLDRAERSAGKVFKASISKHIMKKLKQI